MREEADFYAHCPGCGYQLEWTFQEIIDQGSVVACPRCQTILALKAAEDGAPGGAQA